MSIKLFILGTLNDHGSCHPYLIKKILAEAIPVTEVLNISDGKLYYHFEALEKKGHIAQVEVIHEGNRPEKTLYKITPSGREELEMEIYKGFSKTADITNLYAAIGFLRYADTNKVARILERSIEKQKSRWALYSKLYNNHLDNENFKDSEELHLIKEHAFNKAQFDIAWLEKVLEYVKRFDKDSVS